MNTTATATQPATALTHHPKTVTTAAGWTMDVEYLGEGNWEVETPNGTWTITSTGTDPVGAEDDSFHISHDENHHQPEGWVDSPAEAILWLEANGVDRRTTRTRKA